MEEFIVNFFLGILCGAGIWIVVEMAIALNMLFIDLIEEFKEKRRKRNVKSDDL